jgi:hypothetical protein
VLDHQMRYHLTEQEIAGLPFAQPMALHQVANRIRVSPNKPLDAFTNRQEIQP